MSTSGRTLVVLPRRQVGRRAPGQPASGQDLHPRLGRSSFCGLPSADLRPFGPHSPSNSQGPSQRSVEPSLALAGNLSIFSRGPGGGVGSAGPLLHGRLFTLTLLAQAAREAATTLLAALICSGLDCISKSLSPGATGRKQSAIQPPLCSCSGSSMDRPSDTHPARLPGGYRPGPSAREPGEPSGKAPGGHE